MHLFYYYKSKLPLLNYTDLKISSISENTDYIELKHLIDIFFPFFFF